MAYRKLGRNSSARKALFRSVIVALFTHERIETTEAKAKAFFISFLLAYFFVILILPP